MSVIVDKLATKVRYFFFPTMLKQISLSRVDAITTFMVDVQLILFRPKERVILEKLIAVTNLLPHFWKCNYDFYGRPTMNSNTFLP